MISKIFRRCPRCASENIVWSDERRLECRACQFTYYHNQAAAVSVIVRHGEKILLTVRKEDPAQNSWDLPGGFVDPYEDAAQAAVRELKEEIGLNIPTGELRYFDTAPNEYLYKEVLYRTLDIVFTTQIAGDDVRLADPDEIKAVFWILPRDIDLEKIGFISARKILRKYIESLEWL